MKRKVIEIRKLRRIQIDGEWWNVVGRVFGQETTRYKFGWGMYILGRHGKRLLLPHDAGMQPFDMVYAVRPAKLGEVDLKTTKHEIKEN